MRPQNENEKMKLRKTTWTVLCLVLTITIPVGCRHSDPTAKCNYTLIPFENDEGLYGYMETDGDIVIEARFEEAKAFSNSLALVRIDGEYGYIDEKGNVVIPAIYQYGTPFRDGYAFVQAKEKHFICIDREGKMAFEMPNCIAVRAFSEQMASFCNTLGKWGYVNIDGEVIYIPTFEKTADFHEGVAAIQMHGKWGLVNNKGEFVVKPIYTSLGFEKESDNE